MKITKQQFETIVSKMVKAEVKKALADNSGTSVERFFTNPGIQDVIKELIPGIVDRWLSNNVKNLLDRLEFTEPYSKEKAFQKATELANAFKKDVKMGKFNTKPEGNRTELDLDTNGKKKMYFYFDANEKRQPVARLLSDLLPIELFNRDGNRDGVYPDSWYDQASWIDGKLEDKISENLVRIWSDFLSQQRIKNS